MGMVGADGMRITDRLTWRDRAIGGALLLIILALLWLLASCAPDPQPTLTPAPLPTRVAETHELYFPMVVVRSWPDIKCKRGIGIPGEGQPYAGNEWDGCWYYNWSPLRDNWKRMPAFQSVFVPMVWSGTDWEFAQVADCPQIIMAINEPDLFGQANRTPQQAAVLIKRLAAQCPQSRIIGPHLSQLDLLAHGGQWLAAFLQACAECDMTLGLHAYNIANVAEFARIYLDFAQAHGYTGSAIWLSEFANCATNDPAGWMRDTLAQLDEAEHVEAYAIFALRNNGIWPGLECAEVVDKSGRLTAVGEIYRSGAALAAYP